MSADKTLEVAERIFIDLVVQDMGSDKLRDPYTFDKDDHRDLRYEAIAKRAHQAAKVWVKYREAVFSSPQT